MLRIFITASDDNLDFRAEVYGIESFDIAEEKLGQFRRSYEKRVAMELTEDNHE